MHLFLGAAHIVLIAWIAWNDWPAHLDVGLTQDAHQGLRLARHEALVCLIVLAGCTWLVHRCCTPFDGSHPSPERIQGTHLVSQSPTLKWVAGGVWDEFQKRMPLLWAWSGSIHGMQLFSVYSISGVAMRVLRLATRMVAGMWTNPSLPAVRMFGPDLRPRPFHPGMDIDARR